MTRPAIDTKAAVEVAQSAAGILPQVGKTAVLDHLVASMTPEALKALSPEVRGKLQQALAGTEAAPSSTQKTSLQTAQEMVNSYRFDEQTGASTFTVPAGVTDVEAMKALNEYFRKNLPNFHRDAIYVGDLNWYENLPQAYSAYCQERGCSQARQIATTGVVNGTRNEDRATEEAVLKKKSLVFADPRDQALAAAIHACTNNGEDLLENLLVRGSVPGFALYTDPLHGVLVDRYGDDRVSHVAASGSPSPELK